MGIQRVVTFAEADDDMYGGICVAILVECDRYEAKIVGSITEPEAIA